MARKVFYSFHYDDDSHRVQLVKNMGAVEGQPILTSNEWEKVEEAGKSAIEKWIDEKMSGKSCVVVLIGRHTAGRKWVGYEIEKGWNDGKGLLGIYIHGLADMNEHTTAKGTNPFSGFIVGKDKKKLDLVVPVHDPSGSTTKARYKTIEDNVEDWVEKAIEIRENFTG
jgi:hypothetical protein